MADATGVPRFLIKTLLLPRDVPLAADGLPGGFTVEPLFTSIGAAPGRGAAPQASWQLLRPARSVTENPWDLCHRLAADGLGPAGAPIAFAEPDLEQRWLVGRPGALGLALSAGCDVTRPQNGRYPAGATDLWFRDASHGQYDAALAQSPDPGDGRRVRVAHLDTGYDPRHRTLPRHLNLALQKNFVDDGRPDDASDDTSGAFTNLGHGTGTLSILAGADAGDGRPCGVAPDAEVVPVRVADRVVLFRNSAIARAFDYVHGLCRSPATAIDVVTMSMGGIASQAWAEAVNALYEAGVFVVTAAGNNYANLPTREIVYPARFNRVVAACGVMADGGPYADLAVDLMAGNYGPAEKMGTALAAYTPNTSWARFGYPSTVDHDGNGTSAATPQVAAVAALWIQRNRAALAGYPEPWMRVEAIRSALFAGARPDAARQDHLGHGRLDALGALGQAALPAGQLTKQPVDQAWFPLASILTGSSLAAPASAPMLRLEALQVAQASGIEMTVAPAEAEPRRLARLTDALLAQPGLSPQLRAALGDGPGRPSAGPPDTPATRSSPASALRLAMALAPEHPAPAERKLRVYAYDPALSAEIETAGVNEATVGVMWEEDLRPGPVGEYVEVVDYDPPSGCCYAPVDLNHPHLLARGGLPASEGNPQFHQQMAYAVSMRTIARFERALGRRALWSPRAVTDADGRVVDQEYVQRLRIYPHALRAANAFYSAERKALLLGYFRARDVEAGTALPGGQVFCAVSHDILAHETAHALLDGLHRRYQEPTNPDMLAFHEAFADIVALFQHFSIPEALFQQISRTRGRLEEASVLGSLAVQFGQATRGGYAALREAIGTRDPATGTWTPAKPARTDYDPAKEPHALGAVLVSAVFAAFVALFRARTADLVRLVTNGSGVLPDGDISYDLATRLAAEASKLAGQVLGMCIRALDYCPPVDLTFGEYLRAIVTADRDLVPDDPRRYRVAFISAFRDRGIYPAGVRSLSAESLLWQPPPLPLKGLERIVDEMDLGWDTLTDRRTAYATSKLNAVKFRSWLLAAAQGEALAALGFDLPAGQQVIAGCAGELRPIEIHSVRPARRIGPDGQTRTTLVVEITQTFRQAAPVPGLRRGGCTLLIDLEANSAQYFIGKRLTGMVQRAAALAADGGVDGRPLRGNYYPAACAPKEPFALLHGPH